MPHALFPERLPSGLACHKRRLPIIAWVRPFATLDEPGILQLLGNGGAVYHGADREFRVPCEGLGQNGMVNGQA